MFRKCICLILALTLCFALFGCSDRISDITPDTGDTSASSQITVSSEEAASMDEITEESEPESSQASGEISSVQSKTEKPASSAPASKTTPVTENKTTQNTGDGYKYNTNLNIEDNVFLDALIYTGYNIKKHRADGNMWVYILAANKRGLGYLSDITYGGGCMGYETKNGKPDLDAFKRGGLVCASYATYVYFNYLPNVAGIDTSSLTTPGNSHLAHAWYLAAKDWVKKGYSKYISFNASLGGGNHTVFKAAETIPIGSIIMFKDFKDRTNSKADHGTHVCIYAGYKNGYHWVTHVGNANGPEFCAIERMSCGPDPQWPLAVITTPSNIRFSAALTVTATDGEGKAVKDAVIKIKNSKTGSLVDLGKTDGSGVAKKEGLAYGDYVLTVTAPSGYQAESTEKSIKLTTVSNSDNKVSVLLKKIISEPAQPDPQSITSNEQGAGASDNSSGSTP